MTIYRDIKTLKLFHIEDDEDFIHYYDNKKFKINQVCPTCNRKIYDGETIITVHGECFVEQKFTKHQHQGKDM